MYNNNEKTEISWQNMKFKVINIVPKHTEKDKEKAKTDIENKLFEVFKKYV